MTTTGGVSDISVTGSAQSVAKVVEEFELRAQTAEQSRIPMFLKLGRGLVWAVYAVVIINLVLLGMSFVLQLLGASAEAGFTDWVYRSSEAAMRPFRGIFPSRELGGSSVLDTSLLFAALVYALIAIGVDALFHWTGARLERETKATAEARAQADRVRVAAELNTHRL
jgi:uncharacterized protein YggT (Ycf19 family)